MVEVEVWRQEFFEESLLAHRASETIERWIFGTASGVSSEVIRHGERFSSEFEIMKIDRQTMGMVTQPSTPCSPVGVGA